MSNADGERVWFDRAKVGRFKRPYQKAKKTGADTFRFEGRDYYVPYARYFIEYLEMLFR